MKTVVSTLLLLLGSNIINAQCDTTNLIPNPSFEQIDSISWGENLPAGWEKGDGGRSRKDTSAKTGDFVYEFLSGDLWTIIDSIPPNTNFDLRLWVKDGTPTYPYLTMYVNMNGLIIRNTQEVVDSLAEWKQISMLFTSQDVKSSLEIGFYGEAHSIDDLKLYTCGSVSILEEQKQLNVSVSPNPVHNKVTINTNRHKLNDLAIYNSVGTMVFEKKIKEKQTTISVFDWPKGIYLIHIDNTYVNRFVIE